MKGVKYFAIALVLAFLAMATGAQAQVIFGVKPAALVQSSYFGFLAGTSMVLQFGLDYARVKVEVKGDVEELLEESFDVETSASMMMPHGGLKLYLKPRAAGTTSPYFLVDLFKAFTSMDLGVEDGDDEAVQDIEEFVQDLLSPWGLNLAFGAEYHFSEYFSMGGEYGYRHFISTAKMEELDMEISTNLGHTYAAISVNFAF